MKRGHTLEEGKSYQGQVAECGIGGLFGLA